MSRAFVKEDDEAPDEPLPERPVSDHPNYVTSSGLAQLEARREELEAERLELARRADADDSARERLRHVERDLRYIRRRLDTALTIDVETRRPTSWASGRRSVSVKAQARSAATRSSARTKPTRMPVS